MTIKPLPKDVIRATYNKMGQKLDRRQIFARPAEDFLIKNGHFENARHVLEIGCGTGRFASRLLKEKLSEQCLYTGIDISDVMIELSRKRLKAFGPRIKLLEADATEGLHTSRTKADRVIVSYVLNLLSEEDAVRLLQQAYLQLETNGLLCVISLIPGENGVSGVISKLWQNIYKISPKLVGGFNQIKREELLNLSDWKVEKDRVVSAFSMRSQILIARKSEPAQIEKTT